MLKPIAATVVLAVGLLQAAAALAAGKYVDMGPYDQPTVVQACRSAGLPTRVGGGTYGCSGNGVGIRCDFDDCIAIGSDLAPLRGNSLQSVINVMQRRAGYMIEPVDNRLRATNGR